MLDTHVARRLAFVRYLHGLAVDQSRQPEPLCFAALLWLHDAVELFLSSAADVVGVTNTDPKFMEYWQLVADKTPDHALTQKIAVGRLNRARNDLKHLGIFPSGLDFDAFRATVTAFFQENTLPVFGMEFDAVSLVDVIGDQKVKWRLEEAQEEKDKGHLDYALGILALGFAQLLDAVEARRCEELGPDYGSFERSVVPDADVVGWPDNNTESFVQNVSESLKIIGLGLDYNRHVKFRWLTPSLHRQWRDGDWAYSLGQPSTRRIGRPPSNEDYEYCREFVIESAIKVERY